jgi:hypothetical protein
MCNLPLDGVRDGKGHGYVKGILSLQIVGPAREHEGLERQLEEAPRSAQQPQDFENLSEVRV